MDKPTKAITTPYTNFMLIQHDKNKAVEELHPLKEFRRNFIANPANS